ncbi:acetyltransferase [Halomicrobium sp. IBSBa]|uniref:Acetyltransferase n=1 Tax=Halomicrobium mukohataei TaxID=57705 RepID=A0A847U7I8_9EURY|nr:MULTISPECIES: maltose acetyltransferase domain-containing protein [Halomicrobium]MBO4247810.1 acetyltransferase [Halomicrobium sp. IBSBa]NLV09285.1 acetyltransferase [Halomicrobium mukohataei]
MTSELEKMLAGEAYDPSDPELVAGRNRASELTRAYNETPPDAGKRRQELLDELFGTVGEATVEPPIRCDYGFNVHVDDGFYANFDCVLLDVCEITFGEHCLLGPAVHVYTATHPLDAAERADGLEMGEPVTVGDHVWIGGQAVLTPGVTVGDRAVVAAGAVVTDDVPSDVVVAGNPATVVKEL